jgi:hypothetical protein
MASATHRRKRVVGGFSYNGAVAMDEQKKELLLWVV